MRILPILIAITAAPLLAQTTPTRTTHPATAAHHAATESGGCARLPELSPRIPALPAGTACAKPLFTVTHHPQITLDYSSPMLSPAIHDMLDQKSETFSLDYIDTRVGTGPLAEPHKWYTVHYTGYLPNGTKFDSSVDRGEPISFPYGAHKVIEGWDMGFDGMHVGGKRRLFVPYQLGYGETAHGPIPPRSWLVFDLELIAQSDAQPTPPRPPTPPGSPNGPQENFPHPPTAAQPPAGAAAAPAAKSATPPTSTQPSSTSEPKK